MNVDKELEKIYMKHRSNPVRPHTERKGFTICACSKCVAYRNQFWKDEEKNTGVVVR